MSYTPTTLNKVSAGGLGSGPSLWVYTTTDAHTDVDATDYFASGKDRGMRLNDVIFVINTSGATATIHYVSAIDSDNNATVSQATLA